MNGKSPTTNRAHWFAALSGPFAPADALRAADASEKFTGAETAVAIASGLALACDTCVGTDDKSQWLMRGPSRQWHIEALQTEGQLTEALAWRASQSPYDEPAQDIVAALHGDGLFEPNRLLALMEEDASVAESRRRLLERLVRALEWTGKAAPGFASLARLRAMLNRFDDSQRSENLIAHGFQGREEQQRVLNAWLTAPMKATPVKALFITGLPGIGKSALLEIAVRAAAAANRQLVVVRLDFDRPTLDVLDQIGLTLETARQIAAQIPDNAGMVRDLRLEASAGNGETLKGRGRARIPEKLAITLGDHLRSAGRSVVIVLDTCEVLRGRGESHPKNLFLWLDALVELGVAPISIVTAGRGDAFDSVPERIGSRLALTDLPDEAAERLLDDANVPAKARPRVHAFARGNPMLLRLAGAAVAEQPGRRIPARHGVGPRSDDLAAAPLYRFLLSRIADPELRQLANPGLVVRRLNSEVMREVLAPNLGLGPIDGRRAKQLVEELALQNWLIEPDPANPGWLRQNPVMRAELLPLLYAGNPGRCAKIDRAAAAWFSKRKEPWLAVETLYHRLQATRRGEPLPTVDRDLALQFSDATLSELPEAACDAVLQARGQRSSVARGDSGAGATAAAHRMSVDPRAVKDLQMTIERGDWIEAAGIYSRAFENANVPPASEAGDAARTLLWRMGQWVPALEALRELDAADPSADRGIEKIPVNDGMARLEMRAEYAFERFVTSLAPENGRRSAIDHVAGRGVKTDMRDGALGFALRSAGLGTETSWRRVDAVRATEELWSVDGRGYALDTALSEASGRMKRRAPQVEIAPDLPGLLQYRSKALAARQLAVHAPYAAPLALMAEFDRSGRLVNYARGLLNALAPLTSWWNGGLGGAGDIGIARRAPIEALTDLGLLVEFAGSAAFAFGEQNIKEIAWRAEVWRRTIAGRWTYDGRSPWPDAAFAEGLDVSLWARIHELFDADNPERVSRKLIAAWTGEEETAAESNRERLRVIARKARDASKGGVGIGRAFSAAHTLIRHDTPVAFVPALATLIALQKNP